MTVLTPEGRAYAERYLDGMHEKRKSLLCLLALGLGRGEPDPGIVETAIQFCNERAVLRKERA